MNGIIACLSKIIFICLFCFVFNVSASTLEDEFEQLRQQLERASCENLPAVQMLVDQVVNSKSQPPQLTDSLLRQLHSKQTDCAARGTKVKLNPVTQAQFNRSASTLIQAEQNSLVDTTPPELVSITVTPQQVDLTTGPQQVEVTLRARDKSGLSISSLYAYAPAGFGWNFSKPLTLFGSNSTTQTQARWQATETPDVFEVRVFYTFDALSPAGVWNIRPFTLKDGLGNEAPIFTEQHMVDLGFTTNLTVLNNTAVDTTPPELVSITVTPQQVDLTTGPKQVEVTLRARDKSGLSISSLYAYAPAGFGWNFSKPLTLFGSNSTTQTQARWQATETPDVFEVRVFYTFDALSPAGVWNIRPFTLKDGLGNETPIFNKQHMVDLGFSTDLFINGQAAADLSVIPGTASSYIKPSTKGEVSLSVNSTEGSSLPRTMSLRFNASAGLRYRGLRIGGAASSTMSCSVVNDTGNCQLSIPDGLSAIAVIFVLEPSAEANYQFTATVSSEQNELDYKNNIAKIIVTGITPSFTATTKVSGNGRVETSSQQVLLGTRANFSFSADYGHTLSSYTGCGATREANSLITEPLTADCMLELQFSPLVYTINLPAIQDHGHVTCNTNQAAFGSTVTCTAVPIKGYRFKGWGNSQCQQQARVCTFVVNEEFILEPLFEPDSNKRKKLPFWVFLQS